MRRKRNFSFNKSCNKKHYPSCVVHDSQYIPRSAAHGSRPPGYLPRPPIIRIRTVLFAVIPAMRLRRRVLARVRRRRRFLFYEHAEKLFHPLSFFAVCTSCPYVGWCDTIGWKWHQKSLRHIFPSVSHKFASASAFFMCSLLLWAGTLKDWKVFHFGYCFKNKEDQKDLDMCRDETESMDQAKSFLSFSIKSTFMGLEYGKECSLDIHNVVVVKEELRERYCIIVLT